MHIFLTGQPLAGKTTLLERILQAFPDKRGFLIYKKSSAGEHRSLEIAVSSGARIPITYSDQSQNSIFDKNLFDHALRQEFSTTRDTTIIYADALGQKLFMSEYFLDKVDYFLNHRRMVGIVSGKQNVFLEVLRARKDCDFFTVTHENRDDLLGVITHRLKEAVVQKPS